MTLEEIQEALKLHKTGKRFRYEPGLTQAIGTYVNEQLQIGRKIAELTHELGIREKQLYAWRSLCCKPSGGFRRAIARTTARPTTTTVSPCSDRCSLVFIRDNVRVEGLSFEQLTQLLVALR